MDASTANQTTENPVCIDCGKPLSVGSRLLVGEVIACGECRAQLEVVDLDPLVIGPVAKIEEDEEDFETEG